MMKLYHGSNVAFEEIDLQMSKFGCGFYLIEELSYMKGITYQYCFGTEKSVKSSDTYARLTETHNGLYAQSTAYIYEYLEKELGTGRMG